MSLRNLSRECLLTCIAVEKLNENRFADLSPESRQRMAWSYILQDRLEAELIRRGEIDPAAEPHVDPDDWEPFDDDM